MSNQSKIDTDDGGTEQKSRPKSHGALLFILIFCALLGLMIVHEVLNK